SAGEVLEVPGPDDGEGLEAVEVLAAGPGDVEAGECIPQRHGEAHVDPAEVVDDALEAVEVDRHVVVDGDPQVAADRVDEILRPVVEGGVDLADGPRHA